MAPRTDAITITPVEPTDEAALRAWFEMAAPAHAHDLPGDPVPAWDTFRTRLSVPWPGMVAAGWLAGVGDTVAGSAVLELPRHDNPENAHAELLVAPALRRRGIGSRLLDHVGEAARAAGRRRLFVEAREPLDGSAPGARFLAAAGARLGLQHRRYRLDLRTLDHAALANHATAARAAATDYGLVRWSGATPERWLDDMAVLAAAMSTDSPSDDLTLAPEVWDADRIREGDAARAATGVHRSVTAAVGPDGHLAAFTLLFLRPGIDWIAAQGATLVRREHRGHRLGMLVKLANLESLRTSFPDVRIIETDTADSNPYMGSINTALGFAAYDRLGHWELDL